MSVNHNDNHHGGPISLGIFMKALMQIYFNDIK